MIALLRFLLLSALCLFGAPVHAAPAAAPAPTATLNVGARTLFVFRTPIAGFSVQDRADGARKRLDKALAAGGPQRASLHAIAEGTQCCWTGACCSW